MEVVQFFELKFYIFQIHPLFTLSVGDFVLSCMWLFGGSLWFQSYKSRHDEIHLGIGLCYILAISTTVRRRREMSGKAEKEEEEKRKTAAILPHRLLILLLYSSNYQVINMVTSLLTIVYALHAFMQMRQIAKAKGKVLVSYYSHVMHWSCDLLLSR